MLRNRKGQTVFGALVAGALVALLIAVAPAGAKLPGSSIKPNAGGGSSGGGTVHTSAPVSGDGSSGTPVTIANGALTAAKLAADASGSAINYARNYLAGLAGITYLNLAIDSSDMLEVVNGNSTLWTVTGTVTNATATTGGTFSANTATTSSFYRPVAWSPIAKTGGKWGFRVRAKFDGSVTANGAGRSGIVEVATSKGFYCGPMSSGAGGDGTHYMLQTYDGSASKYYASTVAMDGNYFTCDIWSDGTNYSFSVNGETPVVLGSQGNMPAAGVYLNSYFDGLKADAWTWDYFVAVAARE